MNLKNFLVPSFFILISLIDMITTIIGIRFFGLKESNTYAFPLLYGLFACAFWFVNEKFIFLNYKNIRKYIFLTWCLILSVPSIYNLLLII